MLVVSPLIALMVDQVTSLRKRGVNCSVVTSSDGRIDKNFLASDLNLSIDSILCCTPEALLRSKWRHSIYDPKVSKQIAAFVVSLCVQVVSMQYKINS